MTKGKKNFVGSLGDGIEGKKRRVISFLWGYEGFRGSWYKKKK